MLIGYATPIRYATPTIYTAPIHHASTIADKPATIMSSTISLDSAPQALYDKVTQIPKDVKALLPPRTHSITSFVTWNLPDTISSPSDALPDAESSIIAELSSWTPELLVKSPIPPLKWLAALDQRLMEWLKAGDTPFSLQHPTVPDLRLPPWGISFWCMVLDVGKERARWERAQSWVASEGSQGMEVSIIEELMERVPWGMMVRTSPDVDCPLGFMSVFLSTGWLAERHFDVFASYLSERIKGYADGWWVGGPYLALLVKGIAKLPDRLPKPDGDLEHLGKMIVDGKYEQLIFPANLNGNHWITVHIDVARKEFCFGTPVSPESTVDTYRRLHRGFCHWLRLRSRLGSVQAMPGTLALAEGTIWCVV